MGEKPNGAGYYSYNPSVVNLVVPYGKLFAVQILQSFRLYPEKIIYVQGINTIIFERKVSACYFKPPYLSPNKVILVHKNAEAHRVMQS